MNLLTTLWAITFPNIDPVALHLGPVAIKWYGLAYLAGLLLGWVYIRRLLSEPEIWANDTPPFEPAKVDDLLLYITAGVVLGGRLGFILFYEPSYYIANPSEIISVWKGGMAFHGALVGCVIAIFAFAHRNNVNGWSVADLCAAAVPIGLFFGRLANFINGELWGRFTDVSWGMVFCNERIKSIYLGTCPAGEIARHPSQLYEAGLEGLVLFIVLRLMTHHFDALKRPGLVSGAFLIGYGLARSTAEFFRDPHFMVGPFTAGQIYSLPMIAGGIFLIWYTLRHATAARPQ
jgi:phosphatidylglycerol:prolipoprotein diacylglycerol transferase